MTGPHQADKNPLRLDPRAPSLSPQKYMLSETRFDILNHADAASAKHLRGEAVDDEIWERWDLGCCVAGEPTATFGCTQTF
jgi:hypothetical protein